ncbi:receptor activity-modifying protein 2 isoform 2-T2 [Anableps anableps]
MNRALFSKMTVTRFSLVFSGCLVPLLICGCTAVISLDNNKATMELVTTTTGTTTEHITTQAMEVFGTQLQFPCENCCQFLKICEKYFEGPSMMCLSTLIEHICQSVFNNSMNSLNTTDWCIWDKVSSLYSNFSICTEELSDCLLIPWPNSMVEELFVDIHSEFFKTCPTEEFGDPPPAIIFALVITPICLIPVMVSLVVLKTKNGDGTS